MRTNFFIHVAIIVIAFLLAACIADKTVLFVAALLNLWALGTLPDIVNPYKEKQRWALTIVARLIGVIFAFIFLHWLLAIGYLLVLVLLTRLGRDAANQTW